VQQDNLYNSFMNIAQMLKINLDVVPVIILSVEKSAHTDSDDQPYYAAKLKEPVLVMCSMDPELDTFNSDTVYVRERDLNSEGWKLVEEGKPESGFFREGWVVDFSQGQGIPIYQSETIKKWSKGQKSSRKDERRAKLNEKIRESFKK